MSQETAAAPAIPLETLMPLLTQHCLDPRAARIFEPTKISSGCNFDAIRSSTSTISWIRAYRFRSQSAPSQPDLSMVETRQKTLVHGLELPETRGRYPAMSDDAERKI
jgi:hypothetical protein